MSLMQPVPRHSPGPIGASTATATLPTMTTTLGPLSILTAGESAFRPLGDSFLHSAIHSLVASSYSSRPHSEEDCSERSSTVASDELTGSLMCQVCADRASGYHYGVFACEGCKGFFRRSIQQRIQYRDCSHAQQCVVVRSNRNRCQHCRFKKCLSVGMSRDAVRFGRVPKREKARLVEEMQRNGERQRDDAVRSQLAARCMADAVREAFDKLVREVSVCCSDGPLALISPPAPIHMTDAARCPLRLSNYLHAARAVVEFGNAVPGVSCLPQQQRINMFKTALFDVLSVAAASRGLSGGASSAHPLLTHSLLLLSHRVNALPAHCAGVLAALSLLSVDPTTASRLICDKLWQELPTVIFPAIPPLLSDLRALRTMHSERVNGAATVPLSLPSLPPPLPSPLSLPTLPIILPLPVGFGPAMACPAPSLSSFSSGKTFVERHSAVASLLERPPLRVKKEEVEEAEQDGPLDLSLPRPQPVMGKAL